MAKKKLQLVEEVSVTGQNGAKAEAAPIVEPVERVKKFAGPDELEPQVRIDTLAVVKSLLAAAMDELKKIPGERSGRAQNKLGETIGALR